jgi:GT2 family glycosyltransferase
MNVFGMVTTRHSHAYTAEALRSFFHTTPFAAGDRFVLIDNDGSYLAPPEEPRVTLVRNAAPLSFAANVNQVLRIAREHRAELFFLNNDLIFTPHWLEPLLLNLPVVLSPVSNGQQPARVNGWDCGPQLDLADYLGHEEALRGWVCHRQATVRGYQPLLTLAFFCVKIPSLIQTAVGDLDERFAQGGEDWDYCLRCHRAGFRVMLAHDAYVLHFMGKSTWRGAEAAEQRQAREEAFLRAFRDKWGPRLLEAVLRGQRGPGPADGPLPGAGNPGHFRQMVEQLREPGHDLPRLE